MVMGPGIWPFYVVVLVLVHIVYLVVYLILASRYVYFLFGIRQCYSVAYLLNWCS